MKKLAVSFFVTGLLLVSNLFAQNRTLVATDPFVYAVSYVEVTPASRSMAVAAFKQFSDASRKDGGYNSVGVFEQMGRPAHFVILEKWADQKGFDTHAAADSTKQLLGKIAPFRLAFAGTRRGISSRSAPRIGGSVRSELPLHARGRRRRWKPPAGASRRNHRHLIVGDVDVSPRCRCAFR